MVYRMSQRPYRSMAERLWGAQSFAVHWPANAKEVCDRPGPPPDANPLPNSSRSCRPRNRANYVRSNRGGDRGVRELARGESILRKIRLRHGGQGGVYASGKGGLRAVSEQSHALQ